MHGQFAWYELTTPNTEAAKRFYPTFTGWKTQPFDADYTLFTSGGVPVAGVFHLNDELRAQGVPPNWMPYIEASNVAETTKLATSLGAKVMHGPVEIPNVGHIAVIQDPQGAVFGVYKSTSGGQSWDGTPVVGNFSWNELMTSDHEKAFDFYKRLFGWDKTGEMDMGGGAMYRMFGKGSAMYGGMYTQPPEMAGMHPFWLCYIHVKSVPKALAAATKAGAAVHRPPMEIPGGVIAILGDPEGAGFALHHQNAAAPPPRSDAKKVKAAKRPAKAKSKPAAAKKSKTKAKSRTAPARKKKAVRKPAARSARAKPRKSAPAKRSKSPARSKSRKAAKKK